MTTKRIDDVGVIVRSLEYGVQSRIALRECCNTRDSSGREQHPHSETIVSENLFYDLTTVRTTRLEDGSRSGQKFSGDWLTREKTHRRKVWSDKSMVQ
jgi:hypothetical protein